MDASKTTVREFLLADKPSKKRQITKNVVKFNFGKLKNRLNWKGEYWMIWTDWILPIDFRVNLPGSPNECKEFAMQATLQTYGHIPQSCEQGEAAGNQPWKQLQLSAAPGEPVSIGMAQKQLLVLDMDTWKWLLHDWVDRRNILVPRETKFTSRKGGIV